MKYIVLASGSSGNATLIIGKKGRLLIDMGLSRKVLLQKLSDLNLRTEEIDALLITHPHRDHLIAEEIIENIFPKSKIFASYTTFNTLDDNYLDPLGSKDIAGFKVVVIPLSHDVPTIGFVINDGQESLVYITDTGYINHKLYPLIENAEYYLIESNYDEQMLLNSERPQRLIKRIIAPSGHLSNSATGEILNEIIGDKTSEICLMHLSGDCNTKKIAEQTIRESLKNHPLFPNIQLVVSDREETIIPPARVKQ